MNQIKENIRRIRIQKEMTQQEVADKLFVTRQCVSRWEQGKGVPDIYSIERLAQVLDVTINDIIDDESVKMLSVENASKTLKRDRWIFLGLSIAILSVLLTLGGYTLLSRANTFDEQTIIQYGIITEIDYDLMTLEITNRDQVYQIHAKDLIKTQFFDNKANKIRFEDLKIQDRVMFECLGQNLEENLLMIEVIDSQVEKSIKGVFLNFTGGTFDTFDQLPSETNSDSLVSFIYFYYTESFGVMSYGGNTSNVDYSSNVDHNFRHRSFILTVYVDEELIGKSFQVGTVYNTGIEIYTEDILNNAKSYMINGETDLGLSENHPYSLVHSSDVTFVINIQYKSSPDIIDIYEYDEHNDLIKTTTLTSYNDLIHFTASELALYSYIKVTYHTDIWMFQEKYYVYELLIGESILLYINNEYGFVRSLYLLYQ